MKNKLLKFEYILVKLIEWYFSIKTNSIEDENLSSFTRLKVLKLLFFVAAVKQNDGKDLLDTFNNFYAMQHGPVESDIYNSITRGLQFFSFEGRNLHIKNPIEESAFIELSQNEKESIIKSISALKTINNNIVLYTASQLVNLSHRWESWKTAIAIADTLEKGSEKMSIKLIRENQQYFCL